MPRPDPRPDPVPFVKMHGLGNDYVYLDERETVVDEPERWAQRLSDRHRGIGSDGLIILRRDPELPCRMAMYNADGSRAEMCGNGIRCVAALARWRGYASEAEFLVGSDGGPRPVRVNPASDRVATVRVGMGHAEIESATESLSVGDRTFEGTVLALGNPHYVIETTAPADDRWVAEYGPQLERHDRFPARTNVEFVHIVRRDEIDFRVWERGSGETQACGTGATAAVAALRARGRVDDRVTVHLLGGDLEIEVDPDGHLWMTGPAEESYRGVFARALVSG